MSSLLVLATSIFEISWEKQTNTILPFVVNKAYQIPLKNLPPPPARAVGAGN